MPSGFDPDFPYKDIPFVECWSRNENFDKLVEILQQFKLKYPSWKVMLVHAGGLHPVFARGSYLKDILTKAYRLGILPSELMVTGFVKEEDIPTYFGTADVIVLNYTRGSASASGAAHRALSSHRPIVGTDDPCIQEIPKFDVARFDTKALMLALKEVLVSSQLQKELVEKAEVVAEKTSWKNIALEHIQKVYT